MHYISHHTTGAKAPDTLHYYFHTGFLGQALLVVSDSGLCGLGFCDNSRDARRTALDDMARRWPQASFLETGRTGSIIKQVIKLLANPAFPLPPIPLHLIGTKFNSAVWQALLKIPAGQTATYSDIARAVQKPAAVRAVATAIGRNPVSLLVPCHRILRKDGGLGGYHWGIERKKALLELERNSAGK